MNTKVYFLIVQISILSASPMSFSQIVEAQTTQAIEDFKVSRDYAKLSGSYSAISRDKSLPEENRAELYVRILIAANEYLDSHPKPETTPTLNVPPPDGGIPGVDPASIEDPVAREQYKKDIAENRDLILARTTHNVLSKLRDSIVTYCVSFQEMKPGNDKLLANYIAKQSADPLALKKVAELIKIKEANKTQQDNR